MLNIRFENITYLFGSFSYIEALTIASGHDLVEQTAQ